MGVLIWIESGDGWLRRTETTKSLHSNLPEPNMDGVAGQIVFPILGIVAAAAATFYAVSFMEIREVCSAVPYSSMHMYESIFSIGDYSKSMVQKSLEDLDDKYSEYEESGGRQRRARRRSRRQAKKK